MQQPGWRIVVSEAATGRAAHRLGAAGRLRLRGALALALLLTTCGTRLASRCLHRCGVCQRLSVSVGARPSGLTTHRLGSQSRFGAQEATGVSARGLQKSLTAPRMISGCHCVPKLQGPLEYVIPAGLESPAHVRPQQCADIRAVAQRVVASWPIPVRGNHDS